MGSSEVTLNKSSFIEISAIKHTVREITVLERNFPSAKIFECVVEELLICNHNWKLFVIGGSSTPDIAFLDFKTRVVFRLFESFRGVRWFRRARGVGVNGHT